MTAPIEVRRQRVCDALKIRRARLRELQRCVDCAAKREPGHVLCKECLEDRRRRAAYKRDGL